MPPEKVVFVGSPKPKGYVMVRKGDVYVTRNCRKLTQELGKTVYIVQSKDTKPLGIRVPLEVKQRVDALSVATKSTRAAAVQKKDEALEDKMRTELLLLYPQIPKDKIQPLLKHTLQKRSGRVGRTQKIALSTIMNLAVRAHVRHTCTDYEALLRASCERENARRQVDRRVIEVCRAWGRKQSKGEKANSRMRKRVTSMRKPEKKRAKIERKRAGRSAIRSSKRTSGLATTTGEATGKPLRHRRKRSNHTMQHKADGYTADTAIVIDDL